MILSAVQNTQPDYVALAMVAVLALILVFLVIKKWLSNAKTQEPAASVPVLPKAPEKPKAPGSAGQLKLHNVEPKTAAMLMAIVADKMGKPLNELQFISIKEVE